MCLSLGSKLLFSRWVVFELKWGLQKESPETPRAIMPDADPPILPYHLGVACNVLLLSERGTDIGADIDVRFGAPGPGVRGACPCVCSVAISTINQKFL